MQGAFDRIASALLNALYPSACPVCDRPSDVLATSPVCSACWQGIVRYDGPACPVCAEPMASPHSGTCGRCMADPPPFERAFSFGLYEGVLREAVHLLKFHGIKRLARPLAALLCSLELPRADCIVPVPLSLRGLRERGFNQSLLLGRALSGLTGVPLEPRALMKKKDTPSQVGLSRSKRLSNLLGAFAPRKRLDGMSVMLVDDVVTTGATARECARALRKAGATRVYALSVARSAGEPGHAQEGQ